MFLRALTAYVPIHNEPLETSHPFGTFVILNLIIAKRVHLSEQQNTPGLVLKSELLPPRAKIV